MMVAATGVVATAVRPPLPKRSRRSKLLRKVSRKLFRKAAAGAIGVAVAIGVAMAETDPAGLDATEVTGRPVLTAMAGGAVTMAAWLLPPRLPSPTPTAHGIAATGAMAG